MEVWIMARPMGKKFKECRSLGLNVHGHPKAMKRTTLARDEKKLSTYGKQLLEKQRLKAYYGVLEKQMKRFFKEAYRESVPVEALIKRLEMRLDNIVYRGGLGLTLRQSRQMVNHNLVRVNGKRVNIPSFKVKPGDMIMLKEGNSYHQRIRDKGVHVSVPYLSYDENEMVLYVERVPSREEIPIQIQDHLVTEFYTKML